jgi:hypothetical protein
MPNPMDAQLREVRRRESAESPADFSQLVPFLRDRNAQARGLALEHLVPHTLQGSPHRNIFFDGLGGGGLQKPTENNVVKDLKLLCRDQLVRRAAVFFIFY